MSPSIRDPTTREHISEVLGGRRADILASNDHEKSDIKSVLSACCCPNGGLQNANGLMCADSGASASAAPWKYRGREMGVGMVL